MSREPAHAPSASLSIWSGRLFLWPGRALYVGRAADTAVHAHHAIQLCVGISGNFRLRSGPKAVWREHELALVPPDLAHQLDGRGALLALLYVDPEADDGRLLATIAPRGGFGLGRCEDFEPVRAGLRNCVDEIGDPRYAAAAVDALLKSTTARHVPYRALDSRIGRVLRHVRGAPGLRLSAGEAAAFVQLSSHRFQHIFRDGTGIPFRRYLLWLRLVAAVETIARGASLTDAAHAAGFADSAHLSRTFRRMFGLTPSMMAKGSEFVQAPSAGVS